MLKIFEPITINRLCIKNRLVLPPMATAKAGKNDEATKEVIDYYTERAKCSGIGLIITEHFYINMQGKAHKGQMSIAEDKMIEPLQKLTESVHRENVKIFVQISHAGTAANSSITGTQPVGPSSIYNPVQKKEIPKELTKEHIKEIINDFKFASMRAVKAGFDGVEIHSAHGYLLNQFYSPLYNRRTDEYSSDTIEKRVRIHTEIVNEIRCAVGSEFPIAIRLVGCDYQQGGTVISDTVKACIILQNNGIDMFDITGGMNGFTKPGNNEPGYFGEISGAVKKAVKVPVMLTGGIKTLSDAEKLLKNDLADLIGIGRVLLKNPAALNIN